jgi:hypothetical protein
MPDRPITHPLAIAYFVLAREYWLETDPHKQRNVLSMRHDAGEAWRRAGCPLYLEPTPTDPA